MPEIDTGDEIRHLGSDLDASIEVRDEFKRELDIRIMPWETVITHQNGPEMFVRGAFDGIDPKKVMIKPPDGNGKHSNSPVGRGLSLEQRDDAAYMTFRVSKTQAGDELLTLVNDGVVTGASIGFMEKPGGTAIEQRNSRRIRVHRRVGLDHVITTWRPAYAQAEVLSVRSEEGTAPVPEIQEVPVAGAPSIDFAPLVAELAAGRAAQEAQTRTLTDQIAALQERSRSEIIIPGAPKAPETPDSGIWMQAVLRMLSGERIPDLQMRDLADLVTTDNIGVVPPAYLTEVIGVISRRRPFMETTHHLGTPTSGMSLVVPRIVTRPTVDIQATEKAQLASTPTEIDTVTFDAVTKGGAGDISLQLLKRSSPSFLQMYLDLLFEAYAQDAEIEAVSALLGLGSGGFGSGGFGNGGVNDGGTLDPEHLSLGDSWINGYVAMYGGPDTIWMSSQAVGAFIDAKADTSNLPLYSNLQANITAAGGLGGNVSGLRPVHVPALNGTGVDVLVGPSNGFAWAEDGTYTLQVDVPAKAGRDVAVVGILWFAPLYPTAFTGWALGGS